MQDNSSWIFSTKRNEYYYAPQGKPLLNFRNKEVVDKFSDVLRNFMEKGAGGVRLKNVPFLLVDANFANEVFENKATDYLHDNYGFYRHTKTENLQDLGPLLKEWRKVVKNVTEEGVFSVAEQLRTIDPYTVNGTLVVDLPLEADVFSEPVINVTRILKRLDQIFNVQNVSWPLWKVCRHSICNFKNHHYFFTR